MFGHTDHTNAGADVDYHLWATGVPGSERIRRRPKRTPAPVQLWDPLPQAWMQEYQLEGHSIEQSLRAQQNWHLETVGKGAFSVEVSNADSGFVIALLSWNFSDLYGYYIVLDDDNHESYVLKLNKIGNNGLRSRNLNGGVIGGKRGYMRVPNVYADQSFRLTPDRKMRIWVMYQNGAIIVGEGYTPGSGNIILYMEPESSRPHSGMELYHYGFARHGLKAKNKLKVDNAVSFRYTQGPQFPLPPNPWSGQAPMQQEPVRNYSKSLYDQSFNAKLAR